VGTYESSLEKGEQEIAQFTDFNVVVCDSLIGGGDPRTLERER